MLVTASSLAAPSPAFAAQAVQAAGVPPPEQTIQYPFGGAREGTPEGPEEPPEPRPKGVGILVSGVVLLVAGVPLVTRGSVSPFRYVFDCWEQACFDAEERRSKVFLGVGIASMLIGAGLTIAGSFFLYRHRRWSLLKARMSASPGGFALRF